MSEIDALQIWGQLADECGEAVRYYRGVDQDEVLRQGSADFDQKCKPNDEREQPRYRTDYYVSRHGYMDMHIKQNLTALEHYFGNEFPQPLSFVDFGCGPMTSGLALAEILSRQIPDYKTQTTYFGVDASYNMVNKANSINKNHELFARERFAIVQDTRFDSAKVPDYFPKPQSMILSLSFVLAPKTLKTGGYAGNIAGKLADDWKEYIENQPQCRDTWIIYLNPLTSTLNKNWHTLKDAMLASNTSGKFHYTSNGYIPLFVKSLGKNIYCDMIYGVRR